MLRDRSRLNDLSHGKMKDGRLDEGCIHQSNDSVCDSPVILSLQIIWATYGSMLFIFGLPGNVLVILVLQRRALQGVVSIFLTAVSVFNILTLITGGLNHWIEYVIGYNIRLISFEFCLYQRMVSTFCQSCTSWLLVLVTVSRFLYVKYSGRGSSDLTETEARLLIIVTVSLVMFIEYVLLYERDIHLNKAYETSTGALTQCEIARGTKAAWFRHCIVTYAPLFNLFIFTMLLFRQLRNRTKYKSFLLGTVPFDNARKLQVQLTRVLALTNIQFIITNVQYSLYFSFGFSPFDVSTRQGKENDTIVLGIVYALFYTGFSVNIFLYCYSGSRFRLELKSMLQSLVFTQLPEENSVQTIKMYETIVNSKTQSSVLETNNQNISTVEDKSSTLEVKSSMSEVKSSTSV